MKARRKTSEHPHLKKSLGLFEMTMYGVGIIIGAGIYALIGQGAALAGNAVWLSFVIGAAVAAFTGLSYCELSSMIPKDAAEYNYTKKAFGGGPAFMVGWILMLATIIAASTVSLGFSGYFSQIFGTPIVPVAFAVVVIFSLINLWGIKVSSNFNIIATVIEVGGLAAIIAIGLFFFNPSVDLMFSPGGFYGIMSAAALMFFAFIGFEDIANVSEETKDARRVVPKALMLSIAISTVLYIAVAVIVVSVVGWEALAGSSAPMSMLLGKVLGPVAAMVVSVIAMFSTSNTILISLIVGSRVMYGISKDSSLPDFLAKIHPRTNTPYIAVLLTMVISLAFLMIGDISVIANLTTASIFVAYIFVNASLIALRYRAPGEKRLFRVPLNIGRFPVLPMLGIVTCIILLFYNDMLTLGVEAAFILIGIAMHIGYVAFKKKASGQ